MNHVVKFNDFYGNSAYRLPQTLADQYKYVSMLAEKEGKDIVLIKGIEDGKYYVLKCSKNKCPEFLREYNALQQLKPEGVFYCEKENLNYLIRPYVEGLSLEELVREDGTYTPKQATDLLIRLCERLEEIRGIDVDMVHRDIKPENVIITPDNEVELIDFECARNHSDDKNKDTLFMGTIDTAAPEQYGFSQSDVRTDIYAIGKTICFAMTEGYDTEKLTALNVPKRLIRIIDKCTEFNPKDRYQTIANLKKDAMKKTNARTMARKAAITAAAFLIALAAIYIGKYLYGRQVIEFGSQSMEQAVRAELDREDGPIRRNDLLKIRRLAIVGTVTFGPGKTYECRLENYVAGRALDEQPKGDITDLSILKSMPNLRKLYLCNQHIKDITPIKELNLETLALTGNNIRDISAISDMKDLEHLFLGNNPIESYEPIASLSNLYELNLDRNGTGKNKCVPVPSMKALSKLHVRRLSVGAVEPEDGFEFVSGLTQLEYIFTWHIRDESLSQIAKAPYLKEIALGEYWGDDLSPLADAKNLSSVIIYGAHTIKGLEQVKTLTDLNISGYEDIDLSPLRNNESICHLWLADTNVTHLEALSSMTGLSKLWVPRDLKEQVRKKNPDSLFMLYAND